MATKQTELKHAHAGRAIFTKYHGPTNRRGARVRAWLAGDEDKRPNIWSAWDYETEGEGNAIKAALALIVALRAMGYNRPKKAEALLTTYLGDGAYCVAICNASDAEEAKTLTITEHTEENENA
jgi:hypothetical protein